MSHIDSNARVDPLSNAVSFGFGRCTARPVRDASSSDESTVLLVDRLADLPDRLPDSVVAVALSEIVSPYSHDAAALWSAGVPVAAGVKIDDIPLGDRITIDFDELAGDERGVRGNEGQDFEVHEEVSCLADLDPSGRRSCGVISIEDLRRFRLAKGPLFS